MTDEHMVNQSKQKLFFVLQTFKGGIQQAANLMKTMLPADIETETCVIGTKTDALADIVKQADSVVVVGAPVGIVNWNGQAEKWIKQFNGLVVKQQEQLDAWRKKEIEAEKKRKEAEVKQQEKEKKKDKGRDPKAAVQEEKKDGGLEGKAGIPEKEGGESKKGNDTEKLVKPKVSPKDPEPLVWNGLLAMYYTVEEDFVSDSYNEKIMKLVLNLDVHKRVLADFLSVPVKRDSNQIQTNAQASIKEFVNKILDKRPKHS